MMQISRLSSQWQLVSLPGILILTTSMNMITSLDSRVYWE